MPVSKRISLTWTGHVNKWKDCKLCPLGGQRDRIVLARGTVPCDVLFIGEAPGASEDAIGLPFVGPAGSLQDSIIEQALPRTSYALTNLVACLPREAKLAGYNEPDASEIRACRTRLVEFINLASPKLIVRVGILASTWVQDRLGIQFVDIVHPAAILRMPLAQRQMAIQKSVVILRNAVEDMVVSDKRTAYNTEDVDIPF